MGTFIAGGLRVNMSSSYIYSENSYSSPNGQTWTPTKIGLVLAANIASDFKGNFVAVGAKTYGARVDAGISYSNDGQGKVWTLAALPPGLFSNSAGSGVASDGNGNWVAVGQSITDNSSLGFGQLAYSTNGQTWSLLTLPPGLFNGNNNNDGICTSVASDGKGNWVAVGKYVPAGGVNTVGQIAYSTNGQTWSSVSLPASFFASFNNNDGGCYGVASDGKGKWVAVGQGTEDGSVDSVGQIAYSTDGQTWSLVVLPPGLFNGPNGSCNKVASDGNGKWVAVGQGTKDGSVDSVGQLAYSTDGQTWSLVVLPPGLFSGKNSFVNDVASDHNGNWVAVGSNTTENDTIFAGQIAYSNNGQTWTRSNLPAIKNSTLGSIVYSPTSPPHPSPPLISDICFPAGTPVKTDQGIVHIEEIDTTKHTIQKQPILYITQTTTLDNYLISFEKNALKRNCPSEKTIMSKDHMVEFEGRMVPAYRFLDYSDQVKKVKYNGEPLYNVLLSTHGKIDVNNLICETLHPENQVAQLYTFKKNTFKKSVAKIHF